MRSSCRNTRSPQRRANGDIVDEIFLLEHDPVYTIGRTPDRSSLLGEAFAAASAFCDQSRRAGDLSRSGTTCRLSDYRSETLRPGSASLPALDGSTCSSNCWGPTAIEAGTRDGLTGVWVEQRKIASIGVGVRHWITMHGFALNVCGRSAALREYRSLRHLRGRDDLDRKRDRARDFCYRRGAGF